MRAFFVIGTKLGILSMSIPVMDKMMSLVPFLETWDTQVI